MRFAFAHYDAIRLGLGALPDLIFYHPSPSAKSRKMWLECAPGETKQATALRLMQAHAKLARNVCIIPGCAQIPYRAGRCKDHPLYPEGRTCYGPKCARPVTAHGLCATHYYQQRRGMELTIIGPPGKRATILRVVLSPHQIYLLGESPAVKAAEIITEYLTPQKGSATPLAPYRSKG